MLRRFRRLLLGGALALAAPAWSQPPAEPVAETAGRQHEIRAELAWLADPVTFPCILVARASGTTLEVRGQVPSEAARDHALRLARQATGLSIVDGLQVQGGPAAAGLSSAQEVLGAVMQELQRVLGERARTIEVGTRNGGEITLRGEVYSPEEKLAVGARLRRVRGCLCVVNLLEVPAPNGSPQTAGITPAARETAEPPPVSEPVVEEESVPPDDGTRQVIAVADNRGMQPAAIARTGQRATPLPASTAPAEEPVAPAPPASYPTPTPRGRPILPSPLPGSGWRPVTRPPAPPPLPPATPPTVEPRPVTTGAPAQAPTPAPVSAPPPKPPQDPPAPTGTVLAREAPGTDAARLRQKLLMLCAGRVQDILVNIAADGLVRITVKCTEASAQKDLTSRLLALPELQKANVQLAVEIGP